MRETYQDSETTTDADINKTKLTHRIYQGYFILFAVNVLNGFSNNLAFYIINEYANDAFKEMYFPNATSNSTSINLKSCAAQNISSEEKTMDEIVQEKVSQWSVYSNICSGIPSLLSTTIIGSLSDRYGRQKSLFIALTGMVLKMTFCSFAIWYKLNIYLLLIGSFLYGCTGGWIAVLSISFAYVADLTKAGNQRSVIIAVFELVLNLGFYTGTISSGFLIEYFDYFYPSVISGVGILCALRFSLYLLETLENPPINNDSSVLKKQLKELLMMFTVISKHDPFLRFKYIVGISALIAIWMGRLVSSVELYYILGAPICFDPESISLYVTIKGVVQQVMTVLFVKLFQLCILDEQTAIVSAIFGTAYYFMMGISKDAHALYIAAAVNSFGFACIPILRSTMSKFTQADKQGSIFGALAFVENICSLVGNVAAGAIYSATVPFYKGFVFFVFAAFMIIAVILLIILLAQMKKEKRQFGYETIQSSEGTNSEDDLQPNN